MHTASLPTLFVPHGSPMFALDPGLAGLRMAEVARKLPAPKAILMVSPHWETANPTVSAAISPQTIHDFWGFDPRLYSLRYPAVGSPLFASKVHCALEQAGFTVDVDAARGLDHGAWVPLAHLFPEADIPVLTLSVQHQLGPRHAYAVGQALSSLKDEGILIIGSGNITHNLSDWQAAKDSDLNNFPYVKTFSDWVAEKLSETDFESLLNYRAIEPSGYLAHPRDEHLLPLFTALGAAGKNAKATPFHRGITDTVLAMDGYIFN